MQAVYEEVMRFLMTESDRYKAIDDDKLRLLKHAEPLLSGKSLRLWDIQELDDTIFESNVTEYQIRSIEFLCDFGKCTQNYI